MTLFENLIRSTVFFLIFSLLVISCTQNEQKQTPTDRRKSPIAIANIKHPSSNTYLKIVYGQPYKRDRDIFGKVVPYNNIWRTGANEATEFTTTNDIMFAGNKLKAGTYALFSIPRKNEPWSIILNEELGQWGAFEYDSTYDVMRAKVPASKNDSITQAFTVEFSEIQNDSTSMIMRWDSTTVRVPIKFLEE